VLRGPDRWRLTTGILMLVVLAMLIARSGDPGTWRWLVADKPAEPPPSAPVVVAQPTGPTDEEPDQAAAARQEFQAITDGTLQLGPEEMVAYNRLVQWVKNQSFARLWQRAAKGLAYTNLYDEASKRRGKLVALDMEIRLVRDADRNRAGVHLYEAWATTDESRGRLYDLIVVDFPKPIPVGDFIRERARFAGYFLKLQGYEAASARPGQRPEKAPLLIGRLQWAPPAAPLVDNTREWLWGAALAVVVGLVLAVRFVFFRRKRPAPATAPPVVTSSTGEAIPIDVWLEQANLGEDNEENGPET
jgi:hypothetical protein